MGVLERRCRPQRMRSFDRRRSLSVISPLRSAEKGYWLKVHRTNHVQDFVPLQRLDGNRHKKIGTEFDYK